MSLSVEALRVLVQLGLTAEQLLAVAEAQGDQQPKDRSANAERQAAYRKRLKETGMTMKEWRARANAVIAASNGSCSYCGATDRRLVCDHVDPLIGGGNSDWSNLVAACNECNSGKSGRTLEQWRGLDFAEHWRSNRVTQRVKTNAPDKEVSPTPPSRNYPPKGGNITTRTREEADQRGARLPDDWSPSNSQVDLMADGPSVVVELEKFRDYWRSIPGAKGRKLDWDATWRNWLRNANDRMKPNARSTTVSPKFDAHQANLDRAFAGAESAARRRALEPDGGF